MIEPSERSCDLLGLYDGDFVRNAVVLDFEDGVAQYAIFVLNRYIFYKDRIRFQSSKFQSSKTWMIIPIVGLIDIDAVVFDVGEIDRIDRTLSDYLGGNPGGAAGANQQS